MARRPVDGTTSHHIRHVCGETIATRRSLSDREPFESRATLERRRPIGARAARHDDVTLRAQGVLIQPSDLSALRDLYPLLVLRTLYPRARVCSVRRPGRRETNFLISIHIWRQSIEARRLILVNHFPRLFLAGAFIDSPDWSLQVPRKKCFRILRLASVSLFLAAALA